MGRKGVSKRKPKKDRPFSNADINGSSSPNPGKGQIVQSLVRDNRTSLDTGTVNRRPGSNKNGRRG